MSNVQLTAQSSERHEEVLTPEVLEFLAELHHRFALRRAELLAARSERRAAVAAGGTMDFLPETASIRGGSWRVAPAPADLRDRRVEITGPTEPKMAINALNSGANVWLADLEDANTPHWANVVTGQLVLKDAVRHTLAYTSPEGKEYRLNDGRIAVLVVRPRGWHLDERHILIDGQPAIGALVDFGLYFFHNAAELLARGSGPYFYLPKTESHLEARLWNDVFVFAQDRLGIPQGSVRATVLIETVPAAFEMEEILYELRDHAAGLNAGRWDYLFSLIKYFRDAGPSFVLPDRNSVTMTAPMMGAYTKLLVRACHSHGAFAIGGMAAFIPNRRDPETNAAALEKVRADKLREAGDGFDGSWVAHPDLVPICREVFDGVLATAPNQLDAPLTTSPITAAQLLDVQATDGEITEAGVRNDVGVGLQYLAVWLSGNGAVAINNLMEDAATAEISRSQLWQWINAGVKTVEGTAVTREYVADVIVGAAQLLAEAGVVPQDVLDRAQSIFERLVLGGDFVDFLTLPAYDAVLDQESRAA